MIQFLHRLTRARRARSHCVLGFLLFAACSSNARSDLSPPSRVMRVGVTQGSSGGDVASGMQSLATIFAYEGLTSIGTDGRPLPRIVEQWSASDDKLQWTFTLRRNATFSDGSPVTPEDVQLFIQRSIPKFAGLKDVVEVAVKQPNQVVVTLRHASPMLAEDLYFPLRKEVGGKSLGTGPFEVISDTAAEIVLRANTKYHAKTPELEQIILKAYSTFRLAYVGLLRGEIDAVYDVGYEAIDFLKNESRIDLRTFLRPYQYVMVLNSALSKFKDARVRQALNFAINRRDVIDRALRGHGMEAGTAVWPRNWAFDERQSGFGYDPARAIALLDAAGAAGRPRLTFSCLVIEGLESWERIALVMRRQFNELDIDVDFELVSYKDFVGRMERRDFEAVLTPSLAGPGLNVTHRFWHSRTTINSANAWNYSDPHVDAALDAVLNASDDAAYRRGVSAVQQALAANPPAVFIAWQEMARAVSKRFDVGATEGQDILQTVTSWKPAGARRAP